MKHLATRHPLSALTLGTMTFGSQTDEGGAASWTGRWWGVFAWDTANVYNQGESERIVGKAMKGRRDRVILSTGLRPDGL